MESNLTPSKFAEKTPGSKQSAVKMSASLKEKLRKLGRYHGTTPTTPSPSISTPEKSSILRTDVKSTGEDDRLSLTSTPVLDRTNGSETPIWRSSGEGDSCKAFDIQIQTPQRKPTTVISTQLKRKLMNDDNHANKQYKRWAAHVTNPSAMTSVDWNLKSILDRIKEREEELRKLRLVKLYRTKNDLTALQSLIDKWRTACQEAVNDLQEKHMAASTDSARRLKLSELLGHLQINADLVRYDAENEEFY